jgi:hypothetical protein
MALERDPGEAGDRGLQLVVIGVRGELDAEALGETPHARAPPRRAASLPGSGRRRARASSR